MRTSTKNMPLKGRASERYMANENRKAEIFTMKSLTLLIDFIDDIYDNSAEIANVVARDLPFALETHLLQRYPPRFLKGHFVICRS